MKRTLALIFALLLVGMAALAEPATLTVTGTGVVSMDPDTATITLGVRETAQDVAQAQNAVNTRLTNVIGKLKEMGIRAEDIHTSTLYIYQDYSSSSFEANAIYYTAENTITAQFTDIENAGKYIDAVFQAGANTFNGISFSASNTENEKKQAMELSVQNARKKADVLAAAAGLKITGIKELQESGYGYGVYDAGNSYDAMFAKSTVEEDAVETPVMAEEIQVTATVSVVYEAEPIE